MRFLYTVLLYLATPYILFRLYWKGRSLPAYRERIKERFSLGSVPISDVDIWIHAVSLGEVVAVSPLIEKCLEAGYRVGVTTMTPTGLRQIKSKFDQRVQSQYVPYDYPWALRRFFKSMNARVGLVMETELWPNLIHCAKRNGMWLGLINARVSDRAFQQYEKVAFFFKPFLRQFDAVLAQSELDQRRLMALGHGNAMVLGNLKFDLQIQPQTSDRMMSFRAAFGAARRILIVASTHDDEEAQILEQLPALQQAIPNLLCLIAPRHPERFSVVYLLAKQLGFKTGLRSDSKTWSPELEVVILDSLGELLAFYGLSDFAFVGGSFVPIGGHNVLEPIAMNVPVFCGPYMNNSRSICQELCERQALKQVDTPEAFRDAMIELAQDPVAYRQQVQQAAGVLQKNQGVVNKYFEQIQIALEPVFTVSSVRPK